VYNNSRKAVTAMPDNIEITALDVLRQYPIKRAALFGSAARGDMKPDSDIDIIVEFLPGMAGRNFNFFGLQVDLEEAFGRYVDLITFDALEREAKPKFKKSVLQDMRFIYG
jgi:predicted nucleotidyltransferase